MTGHPSCDRVETGSSDGSAEMSMRCPRSASGILLAWRFAPILEVAFLRLRTADSGGMESDSSRPLSEATGPPLGLSNIMGGGPTSFPASLVAPPYRRELRFPLAPQLKTVEVCDPRFS
jgi:hypothetical protein